MGLSEQYRYTGTTFNEGWGVERIMTPMTDERLAECRVWADPTGQGTVIRCITDAVAEIDRLRTELVECQKQAARR